MLHSPGYPFGDIASISIYLLPSVQQLRERLSRLDADDALPLLVAIPKLQNILRTSPLFPF